MQGKKMKSDILGIEKVQQGLGGGFKYFLCSPLFWEDSHFE